MRKIDLNNKTILFIGAVGGMSYSVQHAKELGAQTIVTDYYTNSQAKEFGDYNIDISTTDIDKLDELIYQYKPDGIFTGFSDVNLRSLSLLARKHNMYSYATEKQVEILQDKNKFKSLCIENGILVYRFIFNYTFLNICAILYPD